MRRLSVSGEHLQLAELRLRECQETNHCYVNPSAPEILELAQYSNIALQRAASLVYHDDVKHDERPPLRQWLLKLQELHAQARYHAADREDLEHALAKRSKSGKPPQRWLGRSPGYYSRGH